MSAPLIAPTDAKVPGSRWTIDSLASLQLFLGHRSFAKDATQLLHELHEGRVGLVADDVSARAEGVGPLAKAEERADAVAVPLFLADVGVEARLEHAAQNRVHHLQREVVGGRARWARQADGERRLRGAGFVDQIDRRRLRRLKRRKRECRLLAARRPAGEALFDHRANRRGCDVADDGDERAARLEVALVEVHHVRARDRLDRLFGRILSERVRVAVEHAWKHAAGNRARLCLRLIERDEPLRAQPFERLGRKRRVHQHVGEDIERRREFRRGADEADRSALGADADRHVRAKQLQRVRQVVAVPRLRAFTHHRGSEASDAAPLGGFELIGSAEERERERHERKIVFFRDDQLRPVRQLRFRPGGYSQLRDFADRGLLRSIEGLGMHRGSPAEAGH